MPPEATTLDRSLLTPAVKPALSPLTPPPDPGYFLVGELHCELFKRANMTGQCSHAFYKAYVASATIPAIANYSCSLARDTRDANIKRNQEDEGY